MATAHAEGSTSTEFEIELGSIRSEDQLTSESRLSTDTPLLQPLHRDERAVSSSEESLRIAYDTSHSASSDYELVGSSLVEKQPEAPRGWPASSQRIKISTTTTIWSILVDISLLALSTAFLAFALFVSAYDQKPTKSHQQAAERFIQASTWGPTIYPILFASIVGRATHAILLWRLERGERIATLDILAGSSSLTSTVVSQFHLRVVSYVGLGLVAIWMLSPVGGQSSFRQISFGSSGVSEDAVVSYVVPGPHPWTAGANGDMNTTLFENLDTPLNQNLETSLNTIYLAGLISPTTKEGSPRDAWGHVKVPRIESYEDTITKDNEGWYKVQNSTVENFSSFIGIPISGIDSPSFIDYATSIEAVYYDLNCYKVSSDTQFLFNASSWLGDLKWNEDITKRTDWLPEEDLAPVSFVLVTPPERSAFPFSLERGRFNCTIRSTYVEVEISCPTYSTCFAARVRRSRLPVPPAAYMRTDWITLIKSNSSLFSEQYLRVPEDLSNTMSKEAPLPHSDTAAIRLSQMLNSYWAVMNIKNVIIGSFNVQTTVLDRNISWHYQDKWQIELKAEVLDIFSLARVWTSKATKGSNVEVFQAHVGWVVALIISSVVLITASVIPFFIRTYLLRGPEVLMNFSSLATRDNPYLHLPATGSYLDSADRSRHLKDLQIRFGDIEEDNKIGRLAIGRADGEVASLKRGRKYA
ncbi:hypothetical protein BKA58DRAFT_466160 [Alternaria rosae]|uniref:uncharacterized protein n=1 Tax=Alternaria rosae TaxID=1187941 RepID=UPI001E8CE7D0|nr:uncharacterized protein BKA58DRAFT_466160 [Alternaria rosae]KAH6878487.1 hypothetical protein BKA58DRAFT_466160 [Alternaria rosae]